MDDENILMIIAGLAVISIFIMSFFQSKSPLDLLWATFGLFTVICGFYIENRRIKDTIASYAVFFGVNIFQWIIIFYIFFLDQNYVNYFFYWSLIGVILTTVPLIIEFYKSPLNPIRSSKKEGKKSIINFKVIDDKKQIFLIILGIMFTFGCLIVLIVTKYPFALYYGTFGIMMVIYGYFLKINKIQMSFTYFVIMLSLIIFQWILIFYIISYKPDLIELWSLHASFTLLIGMYFYIQIRESNMKYIGIYRNGKKKPITDSNEHKEPRYDNP